MIKIDKVVNEVYSLNPTYPRIMRNDLTNDDLVMALSESRELEGPLIKYISLSERNPVIREIESHHLADFEGTITIRNDK